MMNRSSSTDSVQRKGDQTMSDFSPRHLESTPERDPRLKPQLTNSDVRMFESCVNGINSPSANKISNSSPKIEEMAAAPLFRQTLIEEADKYVNLTWLQSRVKKIANKQNLDNIYKKALITLQEGLIEHMRLNIEELVEVARAGRYMNQLTTKNMEAGDVNHVRCFDHKVYSGDSQAVEFDTICL